MIIFETRNKKRSWLLAIKVVRTPCLNDTNGSVTYSLSPTSHPRFHVVIAVTPNGDRRGNGDRAMCAALLRNEKYAYPLLVDVATR